MAPMLDRRPRLSTTDRARLFTLHGGLCHICGLKIVGFRERWDVEHVIPRGLIGKAADTDDNMRPAHVRCHKAKTAEDAGKIAKAKRCSARHMGATRSSRPFPGSIASGFRKRMDGTVERRPS